jgi:hypothetical protein
VSTTTNPSYVQPALVGGLVMGTLSALPLINAGNACCCMWVVGGGVVAAYVFQQNQPGPITIGDGALAGLLAGLVGAVVHLVLSIPIDIVMAPMERAMLERIADSAASMPPNMRYLLDRLNRQATETGIGLLIVRRVVFFMAMLFVGAVFSTIGGVLGALIFRKSLPPQTAEPPPAA